MLNVVATDGFDKEAIQLLSQNKNIHLEVYAAVEAHDLVNKLKEADVVIVRSATKIKKETLSQLPNLKGVLRAGVGIDNVDVNAATEMGVWVWNAPTGNFQATAELAVGLVFSLARRIPFSTEGARSGKWLKKEVSAAGRQLQGSTLGIYGAGNIGLRVAKMMGSIGMKVQICDPIYQKAGENHFEKVDFETLLKTSDFITVHCPLLDSTKHIFNQEAFARMKKGLMLVCAARGGIIKEADLIPALNAGYLGGVALDVFEKEPFDFSDPVTMALIKDPRVVVTPHVGASTLESQRAVGLESAEKINAFQKALEGSAKAPRALNQAIDPRAKIAF